MARRLAPGITVSGPFFERDPRKTFRQNIRAYMDRVAELAEADVKARMSGSAEAAATAPYVVGRTRSLGGKRWAVTARISVSTAGLTRREAIRRQAIAAGRHTSVTQGGRRIGTTRGAEGRTHAFRRAGAAIGRLAQANVGVLTKGLD
jgi:hypothetical protein